LHKGITVATEPVVEIVRNDKEHVLGPWVGRLRGRQSGKKRQQDRETTKRFHGSQGGREGGWVERRECLRNPRESFPPNNAKTFIARVPRSNRRLRKSTSIV
jgi:hypothetical protein